MGMLWLNLMQMNTATLIFNFDYKERINFIEEMTAFLWILLFYDIDKFNY